MASSVLPIQTFFRAIAEDQLRDRFTGPNFDRLIALGEDALRQVPGLSSAERDEVLESLYQIKMDLANFEFVCECSENGELDSCEKVQTDCCVTMRPRCETVDEFDSNGDPDVTTCRQDFGCEPYRIPHDLT